MEIPRKRILVVTSVLVLFVGGGLCYVLVGVAGPRYEQAGWALAHAERMWTWYGDSTDMELFSAAFDLLQTETEAFERASTYRLLAISGTSLFLLVGSVGLVIAYLMGNESKWIITRSHHRRNH